MTPALARRAGPFLSSLRQPSHLHPLSRRHARSISLRGSIHNPLSWSNIRTRLPRIFSPDLWRQIIPSSVRETTKTLVRDKPRTPNPATYFIWIYILIGSQAIKIVQLKKSHAEEKRRAELQIDKLREVVRKLQAGEAVDVEKVLGTGVEVEEDAWESAIREIENEERIWQDRERSKREREEARRARDQRLEQERQDADPVSKIVQGPPRSPGFY